MAYQIVIKSIVMSIVNLNTPTPTLFYIMFWPSGLNQSGGLHKSLEQVRTKSEYITFWSLLGETDRFQMGRNSRTQVPGKSF